MTWKDYQNKETKRSQFRKLTGRTILTGLAASCLLLMLYSCRHLVRDMVGNTDKLLSGIHKIKPDFITNLVHDVSLNTLRDAPKEIKLYRGGEDWTVQMTLDSDLQKFIYDKLRQYQVDWAGVSVLDANTGAVKALVSYSYEDPDIDHLSLRATFPAASIFKVITAGAAIQEKHLNAESLLTYGGDTRYVQKRYLTHDRGASISLGDAFANSTNGIFAKVGARYLGKSTLLEYATAFGFNQIMPFEFPVQESLFRSLDNGNPDDDDDMVENAKTAAGFGSVTLSPLHASLIAASVINEGVMMKPYSIEKILDQNQNSYFEAKPEIWKSPMSTTTSEQIQKMMRMTVDHGTARKGFRDYHRDSILSALDIGGKTGSLTGKNPEGKNEWFVGFAKDKDHTLALGIVIVDKKYWKIRPSELAKSLIRYHFKNMKDAEPKAVTINQGTSVKKATL